VLILALDTSSPCGSLAVLRDECIVGSISTWTDEPYSSRVFRHLEFLLHELGIRLDAFDLLTVATGPGSFTGLRVGLAAAKAWAEVNRKPLAAISALEAVAAQSRSAAQVLVPCTDARRGQVYFGIYRRRGALADARLIREGEERVATPEEFLSELKERQLGSEAVIVTPTPELISIAASAPAMPVERVSPILAPVAGQLGYLRAKRGELADALTLEANYVRRSDAELHWKGPRSS